MNFSIAFTVILVASQTYRLSVEMVAAIPRHSISNKSFSMKKMTNCLF